MEIDVKTAEFESKFASPEAVNLALKEAVLLRDSELAELKNEFKTALSARDAEIAELKQQNQWLLEQLKLSKRRQFGTQSEQTKVESGEQMSFFAEDLFNEAECISDLSEPKPAAPEAKKNPQKKTRLTTDKLPEGLPVEIVEHEIPEEERVCPDCGGEMHKMGEECHDKLILIPASAKIRRHVRHTYACRHCENHSDHVPIVKAEEPEPPVKGGIPEPEAVAHVAAEKYAKGMPLYRIEAEWKALGIELTRQTMSNWLVASSERWLCLIYEELKRILCKRYVLHCDETTLQVLHEDGKPAQSKSYMWLYRTSGDAEHQIVIYEYQKTRSHEHPKEFLKDFSGYLHADGYAGYHKLPPNITVVGCWAHLRRKFDELLKTIPKEKQQGSDAARGLAYCDKLFWLEKHKFAQLTAEERKAEREKISKPIVDEFYSWAASLGALPKNLLGQAIHYAFSQREYLERFLLDGRLEISNNRAERSIKPFVIGRKNWLFSNTPGGANSSAIYYSLIITAKENGLIPYQYLTWLLTNIPNLGRRGYASSINELLPGSPSIPDYVYAPKPAEPKNDIVYAWEEDPK